jgi:hypothetical protein
VKIKSDPGAWIFQGTKHRGRRSANRRMRSGRHTEKSLPVRIVPIALRGLVRNACLSLRLTLTVIGSETCENRYSRSSLQDCWLLPRSVAHLRKAAVVAAAELVVAELAAVQPAVVRPAEVQPAVVRQAVVPQEQVRAQPVRRARRQVRADQPAQVDPAPVAEGVHRDQEPEELIRA